MTDREKLFDLLWQCVDLDTPCGEIADHLLANGVTFAKDTNVPSWIPVSVRLPENDTAVIVATDNGIVFQCLYAYDGWDLWDGYTVKITHWMPLPEPPKEK